MTNENDNKDLIKSIDKKEIDDISFLTDRNWLFIKHFTKGNSIADSYKLAGYSSDVPSAPYMLYARLKKAIERVIQDDGVDKSRLMLETKKLLDIPLNPDKQTVSLTEKLRTIKAMANLLPEVKEQTHVNITNFVINRYPAKGEGDKVDNGVIIESTLINDTNIKDVIAVDSNLKLK